MERHEQDIADGRRMRINYNNIRQYELARLRQEVLHDKRI